MLRLSSPGLLEPLILQSECTRVVTIMKCITIMPVAMENSSRMFFQPSPSLSYLPSFIPLYIQNFYIIIETFRLKSSFFVFQELWFVSVYSCISRFPLFSSHDHFYWYYDSVMNSKIMQDFPTIIYLIS